MLQTAIAIVGAQLLAAPISNTSAVVAHSSADSTVVAVAGPTLADAAVTLPSSHPRAYIPADTGRPKAVEYSDAYYTRLTIHRWGSYAMLPLFAGEYALGQRLLSSGTHPSWVRPAHGTVAGALGVLFAVNTITGGWNLWDARNDTEGRGKRIAHTVLMLAADAGFAVTGALAPDDDEGEGGRSDDRATTHRNVALGSMALATAGTLIMWFGHD
ncbi:MAG TPA: hypothetical protein VHM30_07990 [Gemmatimonadaceae bacterium]|nr:hypothetical protein [Gemmatimonadaceae bacterium]